MSKVINWLILLGILVLGGYYVSTHESQLRGAWHLLQGTLAPCSQPITYSLGTIDSRFGISKNILAADLLDAEAIWEKPAGKQLFTYEPEGGLVTVNLIYDNRQASTDKLKTLGIQTDTGKAAYDQLKVTYDAMTQQVKAEQATYASRVAAYRAAEKQYGDTVDAWNKRGGAPKSTYDQLQADKARLDAEYESLKVYLASLNSHIETLNALATRINQLIVQLNLNVSQYNQEGASLGEFEEGIYEVKNGVESISIYEYDGHVQLVRVLAHEMGHALGLDHVDDSKAIMYKINGSDGLVATAADVAELNKVCRTGK